MIARIEGRLLRKAPDEVVVDVSGVGYGLCVSLSTFYRLPEEGERVALHVYTHVREDALQLYGFLEEEERRIFKLLIGVSKIGPRLARNILSGLSARELREAVAAADVARISSIPGVGRKTVERMVIELQDKIGSAASDIPVAAPSLQKLPPQSEDALLALEHLGYRKSAAQKAIRKIAAEKENLSLEELIKEALKLLSSA